MVVDKNYAALPTQKAYKVRAPGTDTYGIDDSMEVHPAVRTNEFGVNWTLGEPGTTIDWHTHSPSMYQIHANISGRCIWYYKDNDGNTRKIVADPGDVVYLPRGAENKLEVVGDEQHLHISAHRNGPVGRLEPLFGEEEDVDIAESAGLVIDDMRHRILRKDDRVVTEGRPVDG